MIFKPIKGYGSTYCVLRYLVKDDRPLTVDTMRLASLRGAYHEMKDARDAYVQKRKNSLGYYHFVLSPDPEDNVSVEALRAYANDIVRTQFPECQAVVILHDDNANEIKHAHIVINNVDMDGKQAFSSIYKNRRLKNTQFYIQNKARERGWTFHLNGHEYKHGKHFKPRKAYAIYTAKEIAARDSDLDFQLSSDLMRDSVLEAYLNTDSELEFIEYLFDKGIQVEHTDTGYAFSSEELKWKAEDETYRVTQGKLGAIFSKSYIQATWKQRALQKELGTDEIRSQLEELGFRVGAVSVLRNYNKERIYNASDYAQAISICFTHNARNAFELTHALSDAGAKTLEEWEALSVLRDTTCSSILTIAEGKRLYQEQIKLSYSQKPKKANTRARDQKGQAPKKQQSTKHPVQQESHSQARIQLYQNQKHAQDKEK